MQTLESKKILFFKGFPLGARHRRFKRYQSHKWEKLAKDIEDFCQNSENASHTKTKDTQITRNAYQPHNTRQTSQTHKQRAPHTPHQNSKSANRAPNAQTKNAKAKNTKTPSTLILGIGANIGTKAQIESRFFHLLRFFARHPRFSLIRTSPIYHNPPFGYTNQPYFYNALFALRTSLSVIEAFALVFYLERKFGRARQRAHKNAPRTLDIDIIFYNQLILKRPYLTIPHPKYHERPSVLVPMALARILA